MKTVYRCKDCGVPAHIDGTRLGDPLRNAKACRNGDHRWADPFEQRKVKWLQRALRQSEINPKEDLGGGYL